MHSGEDEELLLAQAVLEAMVAAAEFYRAILLQKSPNGFFPLGRLIGHRNQAPPEIAAVARRTEELKTLLKNFHDLFHVKGESVRLLKNTETSARPNNAVPKGLPASSAKVNQKAAKFYKDILLEKSPEKPYPIKCLIGHRNRAPPDVASVAKNAKDLEEFFSNNPDLFHVFPDNSCVRLVKNTGSVLHPIPNNLPLTNVPPIKLGTNLNISELDESLTKFLLSCLNCRQGGFRPYEVRKLFDVLNYAPGSIKNVSMDFESFVDFLKRNADVFAVYKKHVILVESINAINCAVNFYVSQLKNSPNQQNSFQSLLELKENRPSDVLWVSNKLRLSTLFTFFPETFNFDGNQVSLIGPQTVLPTITPSYCYSECLLSQDSTQNNSRLNDELFNKMSNMTLNENETPNKAVSYFLKILWLSKPFKIIPICELFKYRETASDEIKLICGQTLQDFKKFLLSYENYFILTNENVMSRQNIPKKDWAPQTNGVEENLSLVILNFFKNYTSNGQIIKIDKLYEQVGHCFITSDGKKLFERENDLEQFISMFPDDFYVDKGSLLNLFFISNSAFKKESKPQKPSKPLFPAFSEDKIPLWKEHILGNLQLIEDADFCNAIVKGILKNEKVIALDLEGVNLGKNGILSLVQICLPTGDVFIFDVFSCNDLINAGNLKELFESEEILKVMHDCRNDFANLYHQFGITLKNIFDTRLAHGFISKSFAKNISFNHICELYGAPSNVEKDEFKDVYKNEPNFWLKRPLSEGMRSYAALDVACLVPFVYDNMTSLIKDDLKSVIKLSAKASSTKS